MTTHVSRLVAYGARVDPQEDIRKEIKHHDKAVVADLLKNRFVNCYSIIKSSQAAQLTNNNICETLKIPSQFNQPDSDTFREKSSLSSIYYNILAHL